MRRISFFLFFFALNIFWSNHLVSIDQIVMLQFRISPELDTEQVFPAYLERGIIPPGVVSERIIRGRSPHSPSGVLGFYGGNVQVSDDDGFMVFPLSSPAPNLIIITPKIVPIWMVGNTVHHFELATKKFIIYECTKQKDASTGIMNWNVAIKQESLRGNIIPLNAVVLCGEPSDFYMKEGFTRVPEAGQLIFPPIYIKNIHSDRFKAELQTPDIRRLFGVLAPLSKKQTDTAYAQQTIVVKKAAP